MKHFLLALLYLLPFSAVPQSLQLLGEVASTHTAKTNTWINTPLTISNVSDRPIRVAIRPVDRVLNPSQISSLCFEEECREDNQALELTTLLPGESVSDVLVRFNTGFEERSNTVNYFIYNLDNPQDGIHHSLTYRVRNAFPYGILFSQDDLQVGNAYPNPVTTEATIDYRLPSIGGTAKIMIHNILGNKLLESELKTGRTNLKLPTDRLNNGIYFYSLYLNGQEMVTKKLVVRK